MDENLYRNGESQRRSRVATSRKRWRQTRPLTLEGTEELRAFFTDRKGQLEPFFFYDPFEPAGGQAIGSNHDATGVSTQGRYTVRFDAEWSQVLGMARADAQIALVEIN